MLARLNSNGAVDVTFNAQISKQFDYNYSEISALALQADGKILAGVRRNFEPVGSWINEPLLYRLNIDGSRDKGFKLDSAFYTGYNSIDAIAVLGDGKIIVGGSFYVKIAGGNTYYNIVRLNKDGSVDNSFADNGSTYLGTDGEVGDIHALPDGKIMIAGHFGVYNGTNVAPVIRLKANGLFDKTFKASASLFKSDDFILSPISTDSNNVYIGYCSLYNSGLQALHTTIYRFKPTGALDSTYNINASTNSIIYATALDATKQLLIGGSFTAFNGVGKNHIARLTAASAKREANVLSDITSLSTNTSIVTVSPNPTTGNIWLQTNSVTAEKATIKIINVQGKQLARMHAVLPAGSSKQAISLNGYAAGVYFILVENSKGKQTLKIVKE